MKLTKLTKLTKATRHMLDCTIRAILPLPHVTPHVHAHPARAAGPPSSLRRSGRAVTSSAPDPIIDFRKVGEAAISGVVVRWREKFNSKRQQRGYLRLLDC